MRLIKSAWKKWLVLAKIIGNFQSQVIFSLFYLLILGIFGIFFRFFSDPLSIKRKSIYKKKSNFSNWDHPFEDINQAKKQF